jgi:hypothetical protein
MPSYWDYYQGRSQDFWDGVKEGITAYAIWRSGDQLVGCMERPLKEVLAEIDEVAKKSSVDEVANDSGKEEEVKEDGMGKV